MAEFSKIQWTDSTFNIAWGCTKVSAGCKLCYADTLSHRYGFDVWGADKGRRTFGKKHWDEPLKWNRDAAKAGTIHRVFCSSMCDVFEDHPTLAEERLKLWPLIESTPHLDWLLLTKRPENMRRFAPESWANQWPANVIAMTTIEDEQVLLRIADLKAVPAQRRGLSCEPLIGPVGPAPWMGRKWPLLAGIDWVICGGESGAGARPMDRAWAIGLREACRDMNVAFFMKQMGGHPNKRGALEDFPPELRVREYPTRQEPAHA